MLSILQHIMDCKLLITATIVTAERWATFYWLKGDTLSVPRV